MSGRGIDFLLKWMAEHLPNAFTDDPAAISDLVNEATEAANREGISAEELAECIGSVAEVINEAMRNREDIAPDEDGG